jgi:amino acid transporter
MNWIVDWWKLLALVLFIVVMLCITWLVKWGVGAWDWWFLAPWMAAFLLIAWLIDRRSQGSE